MSTWYYRFDNVWTLNPLSQWASYQFFLTHIFFTSRLAVWVASLFHIHYQTRISRGIFRHFWKPSAIEDSKGIIKLSTLGNKAHIGIVLTRAIITYSYLHQYSFTLWSQNLWDIIVYSAYATSDHRNISLTTVLNKPNFLIIFNSLYPPDINSSRV